MADTEEHTMEAENTAAEQEPSKAQTPQEPQDSNGVDNGNTEGKTTEETPPDPENVRLPLTEDSAPREDDMSGRPTSKASRIPKISSRAAFTRTPSHMITPGGEDDGLPTAEEAGVLITELQASDDEKEEETGVKEPEKTEETTEEEEGEPEESQAAEENVDEEIPEKDDEFTLDHVPMETVEVRVTDEDYDTDLDIEEEEEPDVLKNYYQTVCEQLGLVPVEYFLRHIRNNNIRMRYRGLGADATRAIALSLKDSITLEKLDISGNWIGPDGARFMGRLLEENDYLTELTLADNKIGTEGGLHLAKMISVNGGLRKLDVSGNELDDKCAEAFSLSLENNKYLRELNLSHNRFTEYAAEFLGPAISANENLDILDLSWNHLREKGGIAVAKGIKENVRLKVCNLSWNGLDSRGGLAVADALLVNQSLLELDVSGNRLNLEVTTKFAKVLTTNDTVKVLRMGNNLITSAGAIALASAINNTDNCEMEELDLTDVPIEYEFLRTVEDIKTNRPNFRVRYGPIMRAGNTLDDISKPAIDIDRIKKEPVVILKEHIVVNDMRLLDILKRYDEDNSLSITAEDFITALEELAVPYDKKRLQESVNKFAATATGKIYFGSFVSDSYEKKKVPEPAT
ncbi:leucine-rich repeat-containing protein 74A [Aplysia californica]|uniref:Leucine-rich repeat-containing protein 74A n=1 Tax=Aplysia californica TaxID=6500 RepID=A0ABM1VWF7_APLCA|nr:leucine-rich repeat-containing protein 74A [Aplysia californica]